MTDVICTHGEDEVPLWPCMHFHVWKWDLGHILALSLRPLPMPLALVLSSFEVLL